MIANYWYTMRMPAALRIRSKRHHYNESTALPQKSASMQYNSLSAASMQMLTNNHATVAIGVETGTADRTSVS
jgi:hypothetical protein